MVISRKTLLPFLFFILFLLGLYLRQINLSPFKIYPDSYQSLLVALNLEQHRSVIGTLGNQGMLYPDYLHWTRPGYPLIITLFHRVIPDLTQAAQHAALLLSVVSILLAYSVGKRFFNVRAIGFCTMLLVALSFNHTVWSGFILTESPAVFLMLLFLMVFLPSQQHKPQTLFVDCLGGLLVGFLVLTRYEYLLLTIPILLYMRIAKHRSLTDIVCFLATTLTTLVIAVLLFFPLPSSLFLMLSESQDLLQRSIVLALIFLTLFLGIRLLPKHTTTRFVALARTASIPLLWTLFVLLLVQHLTQAIFPLGLKYTSALRYFILDDPLIVVSFLIGVTVLIKEKTHTLLLLFCLLSLSFLFAVYFRTNYAMERYLTHLIPFLLLPAGYGMWSTFRKEKPRTLVNYLACIALLILIPYQIMLTQEGMRNWGDKSWLSVSYEEQAALETKKRLPRDASLLLASFPEPYYLTIRKPTYSLTTTYPYLYIPDTFTTKTVHIIQDLGMDDQFPAFSRFLSTRMRQYQVASFYTGKPYHFTTYSRIERSPVRVYTVPLTTLKQELRRYHASQTDTGT